MDVNLKPLNQQVMVITGASSGIGLATARMAARRGAKLMLAARSEETLKAIADEINSAAGEARVCTIDVGDRAQVEDLAATAVAHFGRVDTWINNAGVAIYGKLWEASETDNRRLFDTNFWGVVNGSVAALPRLRVRGGALINVGSEVSDAVVPLQGMYSASKHAVKGFTDALRVELEIEDAPISVTLIQPTAVNTPYPQHARNYMDREPKLPDPKIDPDDVAKAILDAAENQRRDVKVGTMSKINTMTAKLMPSVGDKMSGKLADKQQYDEPPRHPQGTLFHPGRTGSVRGDGGDASANRT